MIAENRKARHQYHLLERVEAGLALTGTEVKSLRDGHATLQRAYADVKDGELWLVGANIAAYDRGSTGQHDPERPRKLLLHRRADRLADGQGAGARAHARSRCASTSRTGARRSSSPSRAARTCATSAATSRNAMRNATWSGRSRAAADLGTSPRGASILAQVRTPDCGPRASPSRRAGQKGGGALSLVSVTVNGTSYEREVEPRMLLVDFIREDLDLTGTKIACDTSVCGACTVHLDGRAVKSCTRARRPGRRRRDHDDRGPDLERRAPRRAGGLPRPARAAVRLLHARHDHDDGRSARRRTRHRATRRSARRSRATSAAAPATRTSSAPSAQAARR